jgi:hypothetical protein
MLATLTVSTADSFTKVSAVQLKKLQNDGKELAILDPREEGTYGLGCRDIGRVSALPNKLCFGCA